MTAYEILAQIEAQGWTCSRELIDQYFNWVASATSEQQIELELTVDVNDLNLFSTKSAQTIRITE